MTKRNITELLKDLEKESNEKESLLKYYQQNEVDKKEVDKLIINQNIDLKFEKPPTENIWSNIEILRKNIKKMNEEINLYANLRKPKLRYF